MNAEQRKEKIKTLRKQEDRKQRLPEYITAMTSISEKVISENYILAIEQIEQTLIELNGADFNFNYLNLSFAENDIKNLKKTLLALKLELSKENYLKLYRFSEIAILKIETNFIIDKFVEVINFDGDSFCVYDENFKNGLWIDYSQNYWFINNKLEFLWIYELRIFGKEWMKLINTEI
ncbi:hypothetical protein MW871_15135 [Flavobacterium sp. I-SCBP12n]|uniref:Uncharacterized protein n=1 Tax=Flavobacterium pygoscelis TaxID=2893176 RepID=A0A9X1XUR3_9FLAO|nr:hypothetical protein [Flavobacterium pygoscelis]MCK8143223.1 hypothetical protein [Flavobacterium pygoscelis]